MVPASAPTRSPAALKSSGRQTPTKWSNNFLKNLFGFEWELTKSPAGAHQWKPKGDAGKDTVPDAHDPKKHHQPMMLTSDIALRVDPDLRKDLARLPQQP